MRVLLVRLDGVGDAAVCTPLIAALRAAGHTVGVALTTRNAGLFSPRAVEAEHVLERIAWPAHGSTPASTARAVAEIAAARYDVALVASEEPEAYELAAAAPVRIGFTTGWMRPLKNLWVRRQMTQTVPRAQHAGAGGVHEVDVMYRLGASLVNAPAPSTDAHVLRTMLLDADEPSRAGAPVVLQAGTKWAASGVSDAALRALVEALSAAGRGLRVLAAPHEADAMRALLGVPVDAFARLTDWVAAVDAASAIVTPDTGAAHVAGMLGVPVVDVFPDDGFVAAAVRWQPWASPSVALHASQLARDRIAAAIRTALDAF